MYNDMTNVYIAHIGVGVLILGITVSSIFKFEKDYFLSINEQFEISINPFFEIFSTVLGRHCDEN